MRFAAAAVFVALATQPKTDAFAPNAFGVGTRQISLSKTSLYSTKSDDEIVANAIHQAVSVNELSELYQSKKTQVSGSDLEAERVAAVAARSAAGAYLAQFENQSGASAIYTKLEEYGVKVVNGFSGGAVLPLLDQFHPSHPRHAGKSPIRWITNSNESSAGHIAEGYAKSVPVDRKNLPVGVAIATSGPGVTNLITPLQDAMCDGVPMVVLCGQAATVAPKDAFQSAPAVDLTRPCTKWSYQIKSAAEVPFVMDYAFYVARNGRPGPVFVDLPKDLQNQIITPELIDSFVEANLSEKSDERSFARLVKKYRADGGLFQALHLGTDSKGLAFDIVKDVSDSYKLKPVVQADPSDTYHADHHPTKHIYQTLPTGGRKSIKEGVLQAGGAMTTEILQTIMSAKKPVIIAGQGCNDCPDELKEFAKALQIPVCTTLHGMGCFDERDDLALHMLGMHGHATPNFMIQESDLIICIGSRFDDRITGKMSDFAAQARVAAQEGRGGIIHVDIRLTENAKQIEPTFFVHSTGRDFLATLNDAISNQDVKPVTGPWLRRMKELQKEFPIRIPEFPAENVPIEDSSGAITFVRRTPMSAQSVVAHMNRQLVDANKIDDAIFTTGVGVHQMIAAQLITWTQPRQMLSSGSLGTMGVSLGYAIGAKLANTGKIVISVDGDGSFNMTFTELKTLAEQGIPIKILILDNDGQMMVEYWQRLFHDNRLLAVRNSANPDYVKLAAAFGIKAIYCDHEEDLEEKMQEFLFSDPDKPVLFHARIQRTPCLPMVAPGQPLQDMILEDIDFDVDGAAAPS